MITKTVYLAGPISGLSYDEARNGWRERFAHMLPPHITPCSPMRGKDFLSDQRILSGEPDVYDNVMARSSGIVARDRHDVRTCDAMVACFLGAKDVSIGTCIEFGWADSFHKPIIMVCEKRGNPHIHTMLCHMAAYCVDSLDHAAYLTVKLLTPEV